MQSVLQHKQLESQFCIIL